MKLLIILGVVAIARALPEPKVLHQRRIMPVLDIEERIVGGNRAAIGEFPYQVGLSMQVAGVATFWCSGSLIAKNWILTAAHCTDSFDSATVYLGSTQRSSAQATREATKSDFVQHPDFCVIDMSHDISLIAIESVDFTELIQPVKLPKIANSYASYASEMAVVSGWGLETDTSSNMATYLNYAQLIIMSNVDCQKIYGPMIVTSDRICVSTSDFISTCNGDSGSPLVVSHTKEQVGLSSFGVQAGFPGCDKGYPAGFTRVTSYLDWIKENSGVYY